MDPEQEARLKQLYDSQAQQDYQKGLRSETEEDLQAANDFEYYQKQYQHDRGMRDQAGEVEYDWDAAEEAERLGAVHSQGSKFNTENLWKKQGMGEQVWNAGNRFLWNTFYDTVGGFTAMADLPGYYDPNEGAFKEVAEWAAKKKAETADQYKIHQKEGAGMLGPGMAAWWIENGSGLASSATSFMIQGAGIGKALQGAKWLANLNKAGKVDDLARRGKSLATGETMAGAGKTGEQIDRGLRFGDAGRNLASSVALTQSAAIMSATEVYQNTYDEAMGMGYGEEYAKNLAGQAASSTVNMSRANILLNMTSANRFLGGTKNVKGFKPENFLPSLKGKNIGAALKEGTQEAIEENVELIAQKTAEKEAKRAMGEGEVSKGAIGALLDGNVYGDASYKEIMEAGVLGAIGGIAQTGLTDLKSRVGSATSFGGITSRFGKEVQETYDKTEFYPDGTIKHRKGDPVYELEDVMIENEAGEMIPDLIKSSIKKKDAEGNLIEQEPEVRKKVKLDSKGQPIAKMKDVKYSSKELEQMEYDKQAAILGGFKDHVEKNAKTIATAKYQAHLENVVSDINDLIDTSKRGLSKPKRDKIVDDLARIEMVNSGTTEFDSEQSKAQLEKLKETLGAEFDNMNEAELRQKQEELMEFSLARTAIESFENNTKDHLIAQLNEMKNLTPEQAAELGYDQDYVKKVDDALAKVDQYYDRWMEYNTKRPGEIARALFKNRLKYDILDEDIKQLSKKSKLEHDKAVAQHANKNDVDLNAIDENGVTAKAKYDQAFLIEKESNKKIANDKKLKELKEEQERLQKELDEVAKEASKFDTKKEDSSKTTTKSKNEADEYRIKLEDATKKVETAIKAVDNRTKEIKKTFDKRISDLGLEAFKTSSQTAIYNKKLAAIEKAAELDRIFDELASKEGEAKLRAIQRAKALELAKRRSFLASMGELLELQEEGGGIYWDNGLPGRIVFDEKTGEYTYETLPESEFIMLASQKEFYEKQLKPGAKEEYKKYKDEIIKATEEKKDPINKIIKEQEKILADTLPDSKKYSDETYKLAGQQEGDPRWKDKWKARYADDDVRADAIKELNRVSKLVGTPEVKGDITPAKLVSLQAAQLKNLRKKWNTLDKSRTKAQELIDTKKEELSELDKTATNIPVPDHLKMYKITENKDGSINVSQNLDTVTESQVTSLPASGYYKGKNNKTGKFYDIKSTTALKWPGTKIYDLSSGTPVVVGKTSKKKGKKGPGSFSIDLEAATDTTHEIPVSVKLDYDQLRNLRTRDKDMAEMAAARDAYMKAYTSKLVRLENLDKEKAALINGNEAEIEKAEEINKEIITSFKDLVSLRDFIHANAEALLEWPVKVKATVDHSDPIANQMNSIIAQFHTDRKDLISKEALQLDKKLKEFGKKVSETGKEVGEIEANIKKIKADIAGHRSSIWQKAGKEKSIRAHKGWITKLKKDLAKAHRLKRKLKKNIEEWGSEIAKYETYAQLIDNSRKDINFVNTKLNDLILPIQQLYNDIDKWERVLTLQHLQLQRVDTNIAENSALRDELLSVLKGRKDYSKNLAKMNDMQYKVIDRFEKLSEHIFRNDPDQKKLFNERIADLIFTDVEINIDKLLDVVENMTEFGAITTNIGKDLESLVKNLEAYNKIFKKNEKILAKIDYAATVSNATLQNQFEALQDSVRRSEEEKAILEAFMGDEQQQIAEAQATINELESTHAGSIELLSKVNRQLTEKQLDYYTNLTDLAANAQEKLDKHYETHADVFENLQKLSDEIDQLEKEKNSLLEYKYTLANEQYFFNKTSDLEVMNEMLTYLTGTVDENGNNTLLTEVNAQLAKLNNHYDSNALTLASLDNAIRLQKEFIAALNVGDPNMSLETVKQREAEIKKLLEGNETSKQLGGARQGLLLNSGVVDLEKRVNQLKDIEKRRKAELENAEALQTDTDTVVVRTSNSDLLTEYIDESLRREPVSIEAEVESLNEQIRENDEAWDELIDEWNGNGLYEGNVGYDDALSEFNEKMDEYEQIDDELKAQLTNVIESSDDMEISVLPEVPGISEVERTGRSTTNINKTILDEINAKYDAEIKALSKFDIEAQTLQEDENLSAMSKVREALEKKMRNLEVHKKRLENQQRIVQAIFESVTPELAEKIDNEEKEGPVSASAEETAINEEMSLGKDTVEGDIDKIIKEKEEFERGKDSAFSTVPRHIIYDPKKKTRKYKNGLPRMTQNEHDLRHMKFMNKYMSNPSALSDQFKIEFIKLSTDGKATNDDDYMNTIEVIQVDSKTGETKTQAGKPVFRSALSADIEFSTDENPGIYAMIVDKNGERVYMNDAGDLKVGKAGENEAGFEPVFSAIPNIRQYSNGDFNVTIGDNMILNKLGGLALGHKKIEDFGDVIPFGGKLYYTTATTETEYNSLEDLKLAVKKQIMQDNQDYRQSIASNLKDNKVFAPINSVSSGDLLRRENNKLSSAAWLFDDATFGSVVRTTKAKGADTAYEVYNSNYTVVSGMPYILTKNGEMIDVESGKLDKQDIDVVLKLITTIVPDSKGTFNRTGDFKIVDPAGKEDGNTIPMNLVTVGNELADIGLINKMLNWGGPGKGRAKAKFQVWLQNGEIRFIPKDRDPNNSKGPLRIKMDDLIKSLNGEKIDPKKTVFIKKFKEFLAEKRKHVHFKLIKSDAINEPYYHPELDNKGEVVLKKYPSYKEYLSGILQTSVLSPKEIESVNKQTATEGNPGTINSPVVGKHMLFGDKIYKEGEPNPSNELKVNNLRIGGVTVRDGDMLVKGDVTTEVKFVNGNLTLNGEAITSDMLKNYKFDVKAPVPKKVQKKVVVKLAKSTIPAVDKGDLIEFNNGYKEKDKDGNLVLGPGGTNIYAVKYKKGLIVRQEFSYGGETFNDFYTIDEKGVKKMVDERIWGDHRATLRVGTGDVKLGKDLHTDSRGAGLKALDPKFGDKINSIEDFLKVLIKASDKGTPQSDLFINTMKMGNAFIDKYLPYVVTGDVNLAKGLRISNEIDQGTKKNLLVLESDGIGKTEGINIKYQTDIISKPYDMIKLMLSKKILVDGPYKDLIDSLLMPGDNPGIVYTPHIHKNGEFAGDPIELSIGAMVRHNQGVNLSPVIAHELIHRVDLKGKKVKDSIHFARLTEIRDKLIKWVKDNNDPILNAKSVGPNGDHVSSLAYWMFNRPDISHKEFGDAIEATDGDIAKLMEYEFKTGKIKADGSMNEFFANVMNNREFQEFLNRVPMAGKTGLGMKTKKGIKNIFQEFINILKAILADIGIDIKSDHVLEEVLEVGARYYKEKGLFTNISDSEMAKATYTEILETVDDTKETEATEETEAEEVTLDDLFIDDETSPIVEDSTEAAAEAEAETTEEVKEETTETTEETQETQVTEELTHEEKLDDILARIEKIPGLSQKEIGALEDIMYGALENSSTEKYDELLAMDIKTFETTIKDPNTQYSLQSVQYSLQNVNEGNDFGITDSELLKLRDSRNFTEMLKQLLEPTENIAFKTQLKKDKGFEQHVLQLHGVRPTFANREQLISAMNTYIDKLFNPQETDFTATGIVKEGLDSLQNSLDKINFETSKQVEMSKEIEELSSNYDFDGVKLSQVQKTSLTEGMTHFLFDVFRDAGDADAFFAGTVELDVVYSKVRESMLQYFDDMIDVLRLERKGKDPSDRTPARKWQFRKQGARGVAVKMITKMNRKKGVSRADKELIKQQFADIMMIRKEFLANTKENKKRFKSLVKTHADIVKNLGFTFTEDAIDKAMFDNENEAIKDKAFFDNSTEHNQKDSVPGAIKLLIGSLVNQRVNHSISNVGNNGVQYENITNYLGLPQPNQFNDVYNLLVKKLANVPGDTAKIMKVLNDAMHAEQQHSVNGSTLKSLTNAESILNRIGELGAENNNITLNELNILTQFVQTFTKFSPKFILTNVDQDGVLHYFDANKQRSSEQLLSMWQESFNNNLTDATTTDENGNPMSIKGLSQDAVDTFADAVTEAEQMMANYRKTGTQNIKQAAFGKLRNALNSIGIEVKDVNTLNQKIIDSSESESQPDNIFTILTAKGSVVKTLVERAGSDAMKRKHGIKFDPNKDKADVTYNPHNDLSIKGTLKKIAEAVAETSNQVVDNQFISVDGKTIYAATLNHFLSIATNRINYALQDPNGDIRRDAPHLFNVFTKNSQALKWLMGKDGNPEAIIEMGMFNGVTASGFDGIVTKDLDSPDKWSTMLAATMKGYYTFFRAADRSTENFFVFRNPKTMAIKKLYHGAGKTARGNALEAYHGYLLDEVNAMIQYKNGVGKDLKFYGGKDNKGAEFRFFSDDKLTKAMKKEILGRIKRGQKLETITKYLDGQRDAIEASITASFERKAASVKNRIKLDGLLALVKPSTRNKKVFSRDNQGKMKVTTEQKEHALGMYYKGIPGDVLAPYLKGVDFTSDEYTVPFKKKGFKATRIPNKEKIAAKYDEALDNLLFDFNLFQTGAYIEQSKLLTGDPAMYKDSDDFFKRMSMLNSTKEVSVMDPRVDNVLNNTNTIKLKDGDKDIHVDFGPLSPKELRELVKSDYNLNSSKVFSKTRKEKLQKLIDNKDLNSLTIVPQLGFNPDHILSGESYDGSFKSMILEDIDTQSELAVDHVTRTTFEDGKAIYWSGNEKDGWTKLDESQDKMVKDATGNIVSYPQVSLLRKVFTEGFYNDTEGLYGDQVPVDKIESKVNSYLYPYKNMEEADAQAYTTMAGYKEILFRAGAWTPGHEEAYKKIMIGEDLKPEELFLFRVLKTQYTGPLGLSDSNYGANKLNNGDTVSAEHENTNLFIPTGYKHSVFPLIPQLIKDTNLSKLNKVMQESGATLAQFTTANKFGRKLNKDGKSNAIYNDKGEFVLTSKDVLTQDASFEFFGVQLQQAPKMKNKITASTQFRKLILSNMIEAGVPTDYLASQVKALGEGTKHYKKPKVVLEEIVRNQWEQMSEAERKEASPVYELYVEYQDVQRELFKRPFDKLIKELELIGHTEDGKIVGYSIGNRTALAKVILEMAIDRNVSQNVKDSIASLQSKDTHIEQILSKDKVENVLFAIINSRVIKEKRKGEGSPQVASSMFEGMDVKRESKIDADGNPEGNKFSSPDLRHYSRGHNNKTLPSHCMLALPKDLNEWVQQEFGGLSGLNEHLAEFHELLDQIEIEGKGTIDSLDEKQKNLLDLITVIGFRIPNQGLNSNDYMRVKKFLPTTAGDSIVVPTEMVAKAGSDYDIDKLNLYLGGYKKPRLIGTTWSAPTMEQFMDENKTTQQERYVKFIFDQVNAKKQEIAEKALTEDDQVLAESDEQIDEDNDPQAAQAFIDMMESLMGKASAGETTIEEISELAEDLKVELADSESNEEHMFRLAQKLAELNDLLEYERFGTMTYVEQNTKGALQNKMVNLHGKILELESNYRQLMAPIDDTVTKDQARDVRGLNTKEGLEELYGGSKDDYVDGSELKEDGSYAGPLFLAQEREDTLKELLLKNGNAAIQSITTGANTFIPGNEVTIDTDGDGGLRLTHKNKPVNLQQINLTPEASMTFTLAMAPIYFKKQKAWNKRDDARRKNKPLASIADVEVNIDKFIYFLSGKAGVGQTAVHITHHQLAMAANMGFNTDESHWIFDHNTVNGKPSFSSKKDKDGEWVSETLSAFLNAYVDIAKDPYIFDMNATNRTANMVFMLIRGGASIPWVTRFISQPIIKTYIQNQKANEPMFNKVTGDELSKNQIIANTIAEYLSDGRTKDVKAKGDKKATLARTLVTDMVYSHNQRADSQINKYFKEYMAEKDPEKKASIKAEALTFYGLEEDTPAFDTWGEIKTAKENQMFTAEKLGEYILHDNAMRNDVELPTSKFLTDNPDVYNSTQLQILDMFLEYQRQSQDFQSMIRATSADTKGSQKNLDDNKSFLEEAEKVKFKERFTNLDHIYEKSVVSEVHEIVRQGALMFKELYYFEQNDNVMDAKLELINLVEDAMSMNAKKKSELRRIYNNDLTTALATIGVSNVDDNGELIPNPFSPEVVFEELLIKGNKNKYYNKDGQKATLAEIIFELNSNKTNVEALSRNYTLNSKGEYPEGTPSVVILKALKGNKLLGELLGVTPTNPHSTYAEFTTNTELEQRAKFSTIQSRSRKMDAAKEDELRNAFIMIKEFDEENGTNLYQDLIRVAINQSGAHHNSPLTYSKLIPNQNMSMILSEAFSKFDNLSDNDQQKLLNQFKMQFLARNTQFIPNVKDTKKRNGEYWVKKSDGRAKFPFLLNKRKDRKTDKWITEGIVGIPATKGTADNPISVLMYSSPAPGQNQAGPGAQLFAASGKFVGHTRFNIGYSLSLDDSKSGDYDTPTVQKMTVENVKTEGKVTDRVNNNNYKPAVAALLSNHIVDNYETRNTKAKDPNLRTLVDSLFHIKSGVHKDPERRNDLINNMKKSFKALNIPTDNLTKWHKSVLAITGGGNIIDLIRSVKAGKPGVSVDDVKRVNDLLESTNQLYHDTMTDAFTKFGIQDKLPAPFTGETITTDFGTGETIINDKITKDELKSLEKDLTVSNNFHGFVSPKKTSDYIMINRPEGLHFNFNTEKYGKISIMERKLRGGQSLFDVRHTDTSKDGYLFGPKGNTESFKELVSVLNKVVGGDVFITAAEKNNSTVGTQVLTLNTSDLSNLKQINGSNIKPAIVDALKHYGKNARSLWAFARNSAVGSNKVQKVSPDLVLVNLLNMRDNLPKNIELKKQLGKVRAERDTHSGTGNDKYFELDTKAEDLSELLDWNLLESLIDNGYGKFIPKNIPLFTPEKTESVMEHKQRSKKPLSNARAKEIEAKLKKAKAFDETTILSADLTSDVITDKKTKQYSLQSVQPTIKDGADVVATKANDIRRQVEEKSKNDPCNQ